MSTLEERTADLRRRAVEQEEAGDYWAGKCREYIDANEHLHDALSRLTVQDEEQREVIGELEAELRSLRPSPGGAR